MTASNSLYFLKYNFEIDELCKKLVISQYFKKVVSPLVKRASEKMADNTLTNSDAKLILNTYNAIKETILKNKAITYIKKDELCNIKSIMNSLYYKNEQEYIEFLRLLDIIEDLNYKEPK